VFDSHGDPPLGLGVLAIVFVVVVVPVVGGIIIIDFFFLVVLVGGIERTPSHNKDEDASVLSDQAPSSMDRGGAAGAEPSRCPSSGAAARRGRALSHARVRRFERERVRL
jgi:hypothetical protein